MLAASVGQVGCFFIYICFSTRLSCLTFLILHLMGDGWTVDILKYCGLGRYNPAVVVSYYPRRAH